MRRVLFVMLFSLVGGCAFEPAEEAYEGGIEARDSALMSDNSLIPNALQPNGIVPNGIVPNGIVPNGLTPSTIPSTALTALQDAGTAGDLSRKFLKYAVGCAFNTSQSFQVTWTDAQSVPQTETYYGSLGIAPEWATGALSATQQRWISACIAARTNYFGISVVLSMRGDKTELSADATERSTFSHLEGAFWGNLFATTPSLHSCYNLAERAYVRGKNRACAAGYDDGSVHWCGIISSIGDCSGCTANTDSGLGYTTCGSETEVVTSFLD
jgi:hypothetical protein